MPEIDYKRQTQILDPKELNAPIHIFGLGTIGSFTALAVTKTGSKIINLWDFDKVESHNLPNQFYYPSNLNSPKTLALQSILKALNPYSLIRLHHTEITEQNINEVAKEICPMDILILAFDNLAARKLVFKASKNMGVYIIDGRMAREEFRIFTGYTKDNNFCKKFEESLNPTNTIEIPCGERSICYNALAIASFISSLVKKIAKNERLPFEISFSLKNYQSVLEW